MIVIVVNPVLGILSLLFGFIGMMLISSIPKPLQKKEYQVKQATGEAAQGIVNSLSGAMVSRMYGLDRLLQEQYEEKTADIYRLNVSLIRRKSILSLFTDIQGFLTFAGVTAIGLFLVYQGMAEIRGCDFYCIPADGDECRNRRTGSEMCRPAEISLGAGQTLFFSGRLKRAQGSGNVRRLQVLSIPFVAFV